MFNVQIDFETLRERLYDVADAFIEAADAAIDRVNEFANSLYDVED